MPFPRRQLSLTSICLLVLAALSGACSEGGSSPTAPPPPDGGGATLSGQVLEVNSSGGEAAAGAGRLAVPAGGVAAAGKVAGITVRIEGTGLSTVTDAQGRFSLGGVPGGDQVVVFQTAAQSAPLPIPGIRQSERIELMVSLDGSTVHVESMERSRDPSGSTDLFAEMQPDTWNTNWAGSSGSVSAFIRGEGFEAIDLDSILLVGTDPGADPLEPFRVDRQGNHVRAFFTQAEAIAVLDTPEADEVHTLTIELTVDGEAVTLEVTVRVVGPGGPQGEGAVDVEKATNGADADAPPGPTIPVGDPVEWTYVVTNTGDLPLSDVAVTDDQGVAVDCPADSLEPGDSMTCTGFGTAEEGQYANVGTVEAMTDEGDPVSDQDPSHYFGEEEGGGEPADLSVEMQPGSWNTNWPGSNGTVSAFIRGEGFDRVDLDSIVLVGSDPDAEPLAPTRVDRQGNHVRAFFAKSAAFMTLDDPGPGEVHTVTIELTVEGEPVALETTVRVVGPG